MSIQALVTKFKNNDILTSEEQDELLGAIQSDLVALKQKEPRAYLELVERLSDFLEGVAKDLKK